MSDGINDILPLIRKHFDFLNTEYGFSCQRTWSDYMARYQGAEYRRDHLTIKVEQADSPIFEVHLKVEMQGEALSGRPRKYDFAQKLGREASRTSMAAAHSARRRAITVSRCMPPPRDPWVSRTRIQS